MRTGVSKVAVSIFRSLNVLRNTKTQATLLFELLTFRYRDNPSDIKNLIIEKLQRDRSILLHSYILL